MLFSNECKYCGGLGDWIEYNYSLDQDVHRTCHACKGKGYLDPEDDWWEPEYSEWVDPSSL